MILASSNEKVNRNGEEVNDITLPPLSIAKYVGYYYTDRIENRGNWQTGMIPADMLLKFPQFKDEHLKS